ncbi:MAG TPA: hypothetical protein VIK99_05030, partial [Thermaerobacter sp.]
VAARGPGRIVLRPVPAPGTGLPRWPGEQDPAAAPPGGGQPGAPAGPVGGGHAVVGRWVVVARARLYLEGAGPVEVRFEVPAGPPAGTPVPGSAGDVPAAGAPRNMAAAGASPAGEESASTSPPSPAGDGRAIGSPGGHTAVEAAPAEPASSPPGRAPAPPPGGEGGVPARPPLDARPGVVGTVAGQMAATGGTGGSVPDGEAGRVPGGAEKAPAEPAAAARGADGTPPGTAAPPGEGVAPHATGRRDGQPGRPARDGDPTRGPAWPRRWRLTLSFSLPHTGRWDWQLAGSGERATVHLAVEERVAEVLGNDGDLRDELAGILRGAGLVPAGMQITGSTGGSSPSRPVPAVPSAPGARPAPAGDAGRGGFDVRV